MRDVAVIAFAKSPSLPRDERRNEVEILMPVVHEAIERSGIPKRDIGFTCSGSCDYLQGQPFSFVTALDAVGAWPPIEESHVEMDAAWALYEAWVRLQHGDIDSALVFGFGKPSLGDLPDVLTQQLDPYYLQPLWPDALSLAALQARALLDANICSESDFDEISTRAHQGRRDVASAASANSERQPDPQDQPPTPLRQNDIAETNDGAAAIVLAAGDLARSACKRPAWIRGIDHRIEPHHPGMRDLTSSPSATLAAAKAGVHARGAIDVAELHARFSHEEVILRRALRLNGATKINPSGGTLASNPVMAAGLIRIGEAAQRIIDGNATRAVAHATSGPCLQQNLVCLLEGE